MDEIMNQPFQQIGMRGLITANAEVADRPYQPFAEMMLPDSIDDYPSE